MKCPARATMESALLNNPELFPEFFRMLKPAGSKEERDALLRSTVAVLVREPDMIDNKNFLSIRKFLERAYSPGSYRTDLSVDAQTVLDTAKKIVKKITENREVQISKFQEFTLQTLDRKRKERVTYDFFEKHNIPKYPFHYGVTVQDFKHFTDLLRESVVVDDSEPKFVLYASDVLYFGFCLGFEITATQGAAGDILDEVMAELGLKLGKQSSINPHPFIMARLARPWIAPGSRPNTKFYQGVRFKSVEELLGSFSIAPKEVFLQPTCSLCNGRGCCTSETCRLMLKFGKYPPFHCFKCKGRKAVLPAPGEKLKNNGCKCFHCVECGFPGKTQLNKKECTGKLCQHYLRPPKCRHCGADKNDPCKPSCFQLVQAKGYGVDPDVGFIRGSLVKVVTWKSITGRHVDEKDSYIWLEGRWERDVVCKEHFNWHAKTSPQDEVSKFVVNKHRQYYQHPCVKCVERFCKEEDSCDFETEWVPRPLWEFVDPFAKKKLY